MRLSIGFSPCPNDTFIFDALVHQKIDTEGIDFDVHLADVEELNQLALNQQLDITKLSYHALAYTTSWYNLLSSGSALGNECGPLLISNKALNKEELLDQPIAIPGEYTTAHFLLNYYLPEATQKPVYLFSAIEEAILTNEVEAGVIIHENRFTYQQKGLTLLQDLGAFWEETTRCPIPLGGIAMHQKHDVELQQKVNQIIQKSVTYAFNNNKTLPAFVKDNATEMSEQVMRQHINLYVTDYSIQLGEIGEQAVRYMMKSIDPTLDLTIIQ